jgi:hypothetical protein
MGLFIDLCLQNKLAYGMSKEWSSSERDQHPDGVVLTHVESPGVRYIFEGDGGYGHISIRGGGETPRIEVVAYGKDQESAQRIMDHAEAIYPNVITEEDKIRVKFWMLTKHGPQAVVRSIQAPTYHAVEGNYTGHVQASLERMVSGEFEPGRGGQLLLWHGPPGTGKTYALRALCVEWRKWCDIEYVVDPEEFFGTASYLMQTLMASSDDIHDEDEDVERRWRLLIFEDTGDLMSEDARQRVGQGLSRLLNVVDGFIGQGLRTLILITTNDEIGKLHPAVSRPGRCAVQIKFAKMSPEESVNWGRHNGIAVPKVQHSLAELFALRDGFDTGDSPQPIGFQRSA